MKSRLAKIEAKIDDITEVLIAMVLMGGIGFGIGFGFALGRYILC